MDKWTSNPFKNKFNSSIRGIDGGPRIIRTEILLSYKIPTMVSQIWNKITLLDKKKLEIPTLLFLIFLIIWHFWILMLFVFIKFFC